MYLKKEEKKDCTLAHMHAAQPFYFDFRFISLCFSLFLSSPLMPIRGRQGSHAASSTKKKKKKKKKKREKERKRADQIFRVFHLLTYFSFTLSIASESRYKM